MATFIAGPCVIESMELLETVAQELCLLDVDGFTSLGCRNQKVGLSAEEGWNLENITNFACC